MRRVAIYLCQRYTGLSNEVIGGLLGGVHYSTVSCLAARVREEVLKDKELSKLVKEPTQASSSLLLIPFVIKGE